MKSNIFILICLTAFFPLIQGCGAAASTRVSSSAATAAPASATALALSVSSSRVATGGTDQVSASGGTGSYTYSITSGAGSINSSGLLTAGSTAGTIEVMAQDSLGHSANASVTVSSTSTTSTNPLTLSPYSTTVSAGGTVQYTATGGTGSYTQYEVVSGVGSINSSGLYTAPTGYTSAQQTVIGVVDSSGTSYWAYLTVEPASSTISGNTSTVCSSSYDCYTLFGLVAELDGRTANTAQINSYAGCYLLGYSNVSSYTTLTHSISCGKDYGLYNWTGTSFQAIQYDICSTDTVTIINSIVCE